VLNLGWAASKVGDWNLNPTANYNPLNALKVLAVGVDIVFIEFDINDIYAGTSETAFKNGYRAIYNGIRAVNSTCTIVMLSGNPFNPTYASQTAQNNFRQYSKDLALEFDAPYIDQREIYPTYTEMVAAGRMFDDVHANKAHYAWLGGFRADKVAQYAAVAP
jgi:hypothetical protein